MADYNSIMNAMLAPQGYASPEQIQSLRSYGQSLATPLPGMMRSPVQGVGDVIRAIMGGLADRQAAQYERNNRQGYANAFPRLDASGGQPAQPVSTQPADMGQTPSQVQPTAGAADGTPQLTGNPTPPLPNATSQEVHRLAQTIYTEAGNEPYAGKVAVGQVAKTRVLNGGGTLSDVLNPGAFEGLKHTDNIKYDSQAWKDSLNVATGIVGGTLPDPTNGATHFYAPQLQAQMNQREVAAGGPIIHRAKPEFANYPNTANIGGHAFFRDSSAGPVAGAPQKIQDRLPPPGGQGVGQAPVSPGLPGQVTPFTNLPNLPSDEQIHELALNGDPKVREFAQQLLQMKYGARMPQVATTPTGQQYVGSPFSGYQASPIPGKPEVVTTERRVGPITEQNPQGFQMNPQTGRMELAPMAQQAPSGGPQSPTSIGNLPPNAPIGQAVDYGNKVTAGQAASQAQGQHAGELGTQIEEDARNSAFVINQVQELRNIARNINPNNISHIKQMIGNTLIGMGFPADSVGEFMGSKPGDVEAFRKVATQLAASGARAGIGNRIAQNEFFNWLQNASPNELMTPQGLGRVADFAEKNADLAIEKQQAYVQYQQTHPPSEWQYFPAAWNKQYAANAKAGKYISKPTTLGGPASERGNITMEDDPLGMLGR